MKTWFFVVILFLSCSLRVHASEIQPNQVGVSNSVLFRALQDIRQTLRENRTEFSFDNGQTSKNCLEYLNLVSSSPPSETIRNSQIRSEYLLCDSVKIISAEPFIARQEKIPRRVVKALFENLDLRTFPSSLRNRTNDKINTLNTLFPRRVTFQDSALQIETSGNFFKLEVVGVIRPGANPIPEWIVWVTDEVKGGNYKSYRTLVVRASGDTSGRYVATMYP